jgi:hypothetical protein
MKRLILFMAACAMMAGSVAAQNPPSVIVHGSCPTNLPDYKQWFQQTRLPYIAGDKRKQQIIEDYSKLKLRMSASEAEKLLGKPDFAAPRPAARLSTSPQPAVASCTNQIVYILKKNSENMADMEDVAVYLAQKA